MNSYNVSQLSRTARRFMTVGVSCAVIFTQLAAPALAGPREVAKRIHDRIAGVPPTEAVLTSMTTEVAAGRLTAAANIAMDSPFFYNVTLKNFATPWTNRDQTVFAPLNDYTATVIGMVRDDLPFNTVLSDDILYTSNAAGLPAASAVNNDHYARAEADSVDLKATLVKTTQSQVLGIPTAATAGVMTTRAAAEAFFIDGTNRAMFRFTFVNHMCHDMEQLQDVTRPTDRIRQDVARSPGGDSRLFENNCKSCHGNIDSMAQAFAYYDFENGEGQQQKLVYTAGTVNPKYFINPDNFRPGFVTPNDQWENRMRTGPNKILGFSPTLPGNGAGAKSLGQELASSEAFATCQVEKVFKAVCFRAPSNQADYGEVARVTNVFKTGGYKLKQVFAETAAYCSAGAE